MALAQRRPAEEPAPLAEPGGDQRVILHGISWDLYTALRLADDRGSLRMTYLEGELEIMSPSPGHDLDKKVAARLIEAFGDELELPLCGAGSTTFRKQAKERGLEPDECYTVGREIARETGFSTDMPDIALEVVETSGGIDKLAVYRGLGVPEVWFWVDDRFHIYHLVGDDYEPRQRSDFLPGLDFTRLADSIKLARKRPQWEVVREFRAALRGALSANVT